MFSFLLPFSFFFEKPFPFLNSFAAKNGKIISKKFEKGRKK